MKNKELMPCPFCGGTEFYRYGGTMDRYWIECRKCGIEQPLYYSEEESVMRWNTRTNTIPVGNGEDYEVTNYGS